VHHKLSEESIVYCCTNISQFSSVSHSRF